MSGLFKMKSSKVFSVFEFSFSSQQLYCKVVTELQFDEQSTLRTLEATSSHLHSPLPTPPHTQPRGRTDSLSVCAVAAQGQVGLQIASKQRWQRQQRASALITWLCRLPRPFLVPLPSVMVTATLEVSELTFSPRNLRFYRGGCGCGVGGLGLCCPPLSVCSSTATKGLCVRCHTQASA